MNGVVLKFVDLIIGMWCSKLFYRKKNCRTIIGLVRCHAHVDERLGSLKAEGDDQKLIQNLTRQKSYVDYQAPWRNDVFICNSHELLCLSVQ